MQVLTASGQTQSCPGPGATVFTCLSSRRRIHGVGHKSGHSWADPSWYTPGQCSSARACKGSAPSHRATPGRSWWWPRSSSIWLHSSKSPTDLHAFSVGRQGPNMQTAMIPKALPRGMSSSISFSVLSESLYLEPKRLVNSFLKVMRPDLVLSGTGVNTAPSPSPSPSLMPAMSIFSTTHPTKRLGSRNPFLRPFGIARE